MGIPESLRADETLNSRFRTCLGKEEQTLSIMSRTAVETSRDPEALLRGANLHVGTRRRQGFGLGKSTWNGNHASTR